VEPHPHFVCGCCGRVIDYDAPELPSQFSKVLENLKDVEDTQGGFVIDYRKTVFNGLCAQCAAEVKTTA
jgi:Fur family peroxide stress response transcriptional regulator